MLLLSKCSLPPFFQGSTWHRHWQTPQLGSHAHFLKFFHFLTCASTKAQVTFTSLLKLSVKTLSQNSLLFALELWLYLTFLVKHLSWYFSYLHPPPSWLWISNGKVSWFLPFLSQQFLKRVLMACNFLTWQPHKTISQNEVFLRIIFKIILIYN